ncbi:NAD-dependent epimerase/dehydratase family protein [Pseudofrankia sp. BMG5.36]|uniref:NAD-dependent epimerase/dehydratase family protein n=2 Tax=unclassified Pseudofrankia TaxID=2994372 RepID=UPI0018E36EB1
MVTGAAGFIGSHLVENLVARGVTTVAVDCCKVARSRFPVESVRPGCGWKQCGAAVGRSLTGLLPSLGVRPPEIGSTMATDTRRGRPSPVLVAGRRWPGQRGDGVIPPRGKLMSPLSSVTCGVCHTSSSPPTAP